MIKRICVFCGSSLGHQEIFREVAGETGRLLASRKIGLVYGGGRIGLMGRVADSCLEAGGEVIGVIPRGLARKEIMHTNLQDLRVVESMHARKAMMESLSDAFLALPGGLGTFEELLETITWAQLGIHRKPIGILNTNGFFNPLLQMIQQATQAGFIRPEHQGLFVVEERCATLLYHFESFQSPVLEKWLTVSEE